MRRYLLGILGLLILVGLPAWAEAGTKTLHNAATANATGGNVSVADKGAVGLNISISGTATVTFQGSADDGVTWVAMGCSSLAGSAASSTVTATGVYICSTSGLSHFQAPLSGCSGCTVTVKAVTSTEGSIAAGLNFDASGNIEVTLSTLLSGEDQTNNLLMTSGGVVRSTTMASAVTTNTTSTAVALPVGSKSIYGSVTGTGAITQTQAIYGGITSGVTSTTGILLCTLTLSGTTAVYDACPVMTANFLYYIVVTTATTGTGASGTVTAMY